MPKLRSAFTRTAMSLVAVCDLASCSEEMMQPVGDGGTVGRDGSVTPPPRDGGGGGGTDGGVTPPTMCTMDSQCGDGVDCTIDTCDTSSGRCRNVRDLTRCACDPSCTQTPSAEAWAPTAAST